MTERNHLLLIVFTLFFGIAPVWAESAAQLAEQFNNHYDAEEIMFPLSEAIRKNPYDPMLHYQLAKICTSSASTMRAIKELELCLQLAPSDFLYKQECKELMANLLAKKQKGKQIWTSFDYEFDEYYKTHPYHSYDPLHPVSSHNSNKYHRDWKVDIHLMEWVAPKAQSISCFGNCARTLMDKIQQEFDLLAKKSKIAGSADIYFTVDQAGLVYATIARLEGGDAFRKIIYETCTALNGSAFLKSNTRQTFKARLASRYAMQNSGSWCAFTQKNWPASAINLALEKNATRTLVSGSSNSNTIMIPPDTCPPSSKATASSSAAKRKLSVNRQLATPESPFTKSASLIHNTNFDACYSELWPLVEKDSPQACLLMGKALSSDNNPEPQPRIAEVFYEKAAKKGDLEGIELLADAVEFGNSQFPWDQTVALLKSGADRGSANCQFTLGRHLEFGDGLPQNKALAVQYYRLAANRGNTNAQAALSRLTNETR